MKAKYLFFIKQGVSVSAAVPVLLVSALFSSSIFAGQAPSFQCPSSPNCVSTEADSRDSKHYIGAFVTVSPDNKTWAKVREAVLSLPRTSIVKEHKHYLHVQSKSRIFRFVDDLELEFTPEKNRIAVKSASKLGYSDMGVNRKRVEHLRALLTEKGILLSDH